MKQGQSEKTLAWLRERPSLKALCDAYPDEWQLVQREIAEAAASDDKARLHRLLQPVRQSRAGFRQSSREALALAEVRRRMAMLEVERRGLAEAAGMRTGKIRFNLINGFIAQRLLFRRGFERKPVSMTMFGLLWPLLWQKRFLMPLVKQRGIYCFYSSELIARLAEMIGGRRCLEVAAGDGTLTRFLAEKGIDTRATDDHSWRHAVEYPENVEQLEADAALKKYAPEVVVCSWPPAGNDFERQIFKTPTVETYIAIVSQHRVATGNWQDYETQDRYGWQEEPALSRLVLPPELGSIVLVFKRKATNPDAHGTVPTSA
jgi:hypothetical protein